ncbi:AraC-like DNA-binding protein [Jejuia pallidilutea]|uniref:AraC-like DNA-binding protein n=1 Tax=Jejuia pallidilutea TaxID=504487 RepID=A0A362X6P6_9FLAO|nr:AraC-like DNA-binding protein [Jejuia pallidilutea]
MLFLKVVNLSTLLNILFLFPLYDERQEDKLVTYQDSLQGKSYKELIDSTDEAFYNNDTTLLNIYRNYHLKKARAEKNNLEMARAYYSYIGWENLSSDLAYSDSLIEITKNEKYDAYPTTGYLLKAKLYYNHHNYNKALDNYITALRLSETKKDKVGELEAVLGIAAIKNVWGLHEEALDIYRKNYFDIIKSPHYLRDYYYEYVQLTNNFSLSLIRNNKLDSALMIARDGMKATKDINDLQNYYDLGKVHATANFYLKKYPQALDSLLKFSSNYSDGILMDSYFMIGKIYQYQNKDSLMIESFKRIDSIHKIIKDPYPELRKVYNELFKYAGQSEDKEQQLYYINQLLTVDSVLDINYTNVNEKMRMDYDIPKFKKEKRILERKLYSRQQLLIASSIMVFILMLFLVFYYKRQKKFKKRLQRLLDGDLPMVSVPKETSKIKPLSGISELIVEDVLEKLNAFEASKAYLSKNITLNDLAKEFNTNSTYLSMIINYVKQVNFSSYLKDLRITNAVNSIKKDPSFLKYSMNGLADQFGFTTAESFSKAFREKTGIKPSYFLNELRKNKI